VIFPPPVLDFHAALLHVACLLDFFVGLSFAYSLVYSLIQIEFIVAYVSIWQSTLSQTVVALVEMMSSEVICLSWLR
jgi:hypothetical protein